jgi:tRNA(Ile)-lysidine synthase
MHLHACDPTTLKRKGVNLQAEARKLRRRFFTEWTSRSAHHVVVLAHHADDQLETFFLQLLRGSGTFGLGGMHPERNGILRPFLQLPKSTLLQFATTNGIAWREDASNAQSAYLRNLFRNEWLPELMQEHPSLQESVLLLMELFRERQRELNVRISALAAQWNEKGTLSVPEWNRLGTEERIAFVYAAGLPVWACERLQQLADAENGAHFTIGEEHIEKHTAVLIQKQVKSSLPVWDFKIEEVGILPEIFDKQTLYLDGKKLSGPLQSRLPQTGDRIKSVGMQGSQLVSDVLKDAGISRSARADVPMLTDGTEILWIPGIKIGRTAIAHTGSRDILKVTVMYVR